MKPTILVNMASYDDWDAFESAESAIANAASPERVRVQIVLQSDVPASHLPPTAPQVEVELSPKSLARGVGPPRARGVDRALQMRSDWLLISDAHMRFEPQWDNIALKQIDLLYYLGFGGAILTAYCPDLGDRRRTHAVAFSPREISYGGETTLSPSGTSIHAGFMRGLPCPTPWASGHCFLAPLDWCARVGHDPRMVVFGDEPSLALRSWTHGYDLFIPCQSFVRHQYQSTSEARRRSFGASKNPLWGEWAMASIARMHQLLGWRDDVDLGRWGLGEVRTLEQWADFACYDLEGRHGCDWVEWHKAAARRMIERYEGKAPFVLGQPPAPPPPKAALEDIVGDVPKGCRDCGGETS